MSRDDTILIIPFWYNQQQYYIVKWVMAHDNYVDMLFMRDFFLGLNSSIKVTKKMRKAMDIAKKIKMRMIINNMGEPEYGIVKNEVIFRLNKTMFSVEQGILKKRS